MHPKNIIIIIPVNYESKEYNIMIPVIYAYEEYNNNDTSELRIQRI